ncbi:hypothetical protein C8R44DRAFT_758306 [Mycena epipterygia]|nr:hypothetical protein C8R44DRAFT_758306 [Mycena epipterygia]
MVYSILHPGLCAPPCSIPTSGQQHRCPSCARAWPDSPPTEVPYLSGCADLPIY